MDKLRALQAFVAIVDGGSLTAAATALDSSLPAMVRLLAALEGDLGVRLLHRTTRRLALTEEGRQYLERARRILADLDEADRALHAQRAVPSGVLAVTAPVLFGHMHVAPAVTRFLQAHAQMQVRLALFDRVVDLVEEGFDVGVRIAHLPDSTLVAQRVGEVRRVVVASPAFLRRHGTPAHPRELAKANCVGFVGLESGNWTFREADGTRRPFDVAVRGNLECNLAAPALRACVAGLGFGRFLSYQAAPFVREKTLRIVLAGYELEPLDVSVVYPSARLLPARTRAFIEWMKRDLEGAW